MPESISRHALSVRLERIPPAIDRRPSASKKLHTHKVIMEEMGIVHLSTISHHLFRGVPLRGASKEVGRPAPGVFHLPTRPEPRPPSWQG